MVFAVQLEGTPRSPFSGRQVSLSGGGLVTNEGGLAGAQSEGNAIPDMRVRPVGLVV